MKQGSIGLTSVVLGMMILAPSAMAGTLVEFEGGIGVDPVSRVAAATDPSGVAAGFPVRNIVRGGSPGGQPWGIRRVEAKGKENGDIRAEGRGPILAGGDAIGAKGPKAAGFVTPFCSHAEPP